MQKNISIQLLFFLALSLMLSSGCSTKKAIQTQPADGTWEFLISTPRGDRKPLVVINGSTGTYEGEAIQVTQEGMEVSFLASQEAGSLGKMEFTFRGTVAGDEMSGTYTLETGSLKGRSGFTGRRRGLQRGMVVFQLCLSVILIVGAIGMQRQLK